VKEGDRISGKRGGRKFGISTVEQSAWKFLRREGFESSEKSLGRGLKGERGGKVEHPRGKELSNKKILSYFRGRGFLKGNVEKRRGGIGGEPQDFQERKRSSFR